MQSKPLRTQYKRTDCIEVEEVDPTNKLNNMNNPATGQVTAEDKPAPAKSAPAKDAAAQGPPRVCVRIARLAARRSQPAFETT